MRTFLLRVHEICDDIRKGRGAGGGEVLVTRAEERADQSD